VATSTFSVRIRRELKERMMKHRDIDWRAKVEEFIEAELRRLELDEVLNRVEGVLKETPASTEPAWRAVREARDSR